MPKQEKKTFVIEANWKMRYTIEVEATSEAEAVEIVYKKGTPNDNETDVDYSFEVERVDEE